jgi:Icc-related predicted phosphoesterase
VRRLLPRRPDRLKLLYAADLHGSEPAFRKFLNARQTYDVDALVFGGDLMGKALVPIVKEGSTYRARFLGDDETFGEDALPELLRHIEATGFYHRVVSPDEYAAMKADRFLVRGAFIELATERLRRWIALAKERLAGTGVRLYLTGGNDDEPEVLRALEDADDDRVVFAEHRLIELDERHTMITLGYSTPTPWDTPREVGEGELAAMIDVEVASVPDLTRCIFNFHAPPKHTNLDRCLKLDTDGPLAEGELPKPLRKGGQFFYTGGGSDAVKRAIEQYQPLATLHGHIHESPGRQRFGATISFNPGSEYAQGRLEGVILTIGDTKVAGYQHTSG